MSEKDRADSLIFTGDDGEEILFTIIADTRINGRNYLLVTDRPDDEECEVCILKETSADEEAESTYIILEDETELDIVAKVFEEDTELSIERSFFE